MDFSYYDSNNQIKKLDIKIGSKWSEIKTDNNYLNSIFKSIDDGDGKVQEKEFSIVKFLLQKADSLIQKTSGDGIADNDELRGVTENLKSIFSKDKLKKGIIDSIDMSDYTIESLRERYPEDRYEFVIFKESHIQIFDKSTDELALLIERSNNGDITISENENFARCYNHEGKLNYYSGKDKKIHSPAADDLKKLLRSGKYNDIELSEQVDSLLEKLNPSSIRYVFEDLRDNTDKSFDELVESSRILKNNPEIKQKLLDTINECLEKYHNYKHDFKNENSKVKNQFHEGDVYTVECQNEIMTITNQKTGDIKTLDLNQLVQELPFDKKVEIKKWLSEQSGEFLSDLATETDKFMSYSKISRLEKYRMRFAEAWYDPEPDSITIGSSSRNWSVAIVHEMGHAMDYSNNEFLSDKFAGFKEAFEAGCAAFVAAGYNTCTNSRDSNDREYPQKGIFKASNYATANYHEMFAECYNYLMTGSCGSAAMLEDFFPDCLRIANEMIEEIRALPDEVRH